ncbi:amidohydrolase [Faecalispora anaeroviscerum]|uniref:amidohydrolase n=1 Tax=Faecalispora anaeroviscerum TaxID=2991836 RepID=UPI0024BA7CE0|nr:amidohydrolase [Faecalispora anaeroviscerum]
MISEQEKVLQAVQKHMDTALDIKKFLYEHPETARTEYLSSKKIAEALKQVGYKVEYPFMEKELGYPTAFRAVLENGSGPSVAIMAEYDALPNLGHGCGHNFHGALATLAALALAESDIRKSFSGSIYVIGTPAEEEAGAKVPMAEAGVFDDMSLACMMHSWGHAESYADMDVLALKCYIVEFFGEEAHAASSPWQGHSALAAARKFLDLIDARRECFTPDARCNAIITDGGKSPNILPDYASVRIEIRTDSQAKLHLMDQSLKKCADGAALALDCKVTFRKGFDDFADMVRNPALEKEMEHIMSEYGFQMGTIQAPSGSSDVGNVSYHCPSIQALISVTDNGYPLHSENLREATMLPEATERLQNGAASLASMMLKVLTDEAFRDKVTNDFIHSRQKKLGT